MLDLSNSQCTHPLDEKWTKNTQLDFRITVAKSLLDGHIRTPSHTLRKPELPLRLTERPFIEPIPKLTEYGGRPNAMSVAKEKESRHHINVKCVRPPFVCIHVLRHITLKEKY